ncbi:hypothetical protein CF165_46070 [Amycolatopsis vastitatis]|uniref:Uncharacterized protein n=1 Tax=Amycolatopsis vastitatis TaxID=1905142 RepID=A0A229SLN8_9PSEU|nr:hypothetical protein CF165_46070 [Amycolatopsis vastitatis]
MRVQPGHAAGDRVVLRAGVGGASVLSVPLVQPGSPVLRIIRALGESEAVFDAVFGFEEGGLEPVERLGVAVVRALAGDAGSSPIMSKVALEISS